MTGTKADLVTRLLGALAENVRQPELTCEPATEAQVGYVKSLARKHGVRIPSEAITSKEAASRFIDQYRPTKTYHP